MIFFSKQLGGMLQIDMCCSSNIKFYELSMGDTIFSVILTKKRDDILVSIHIT